MTNHRNQIKSRKNKYKETYVIWVYWKQYFLKIYFYLDESSIKVRFVISGKLSESDSTKFLRVYLYESKGITTTN